MAYTSIIVKDANGVNQTIFVPTSLGAATQAQSPTFGLPTDQLPLPVSALTNGSPTNPTSLLTRPGGGNVIPYTANDLIADSVATPVGPHSFAIANSGGGVVITSLTLQTSATTGWNGVNMSVNLWRAAPTYQNGDNGAYNVLTGSGSWIGNFVFSLTQQFGDGAVGSGGPSGVNELVVKLASGTSIFWDMQILTAATPISGQTFTLTAGLLN